MSVPFVPVAGRRGGPDSPGRSLSPNVSSPHVVSQPQQQKILQDILDCINDLKLEYEKTTNPIDDDNQTLHRFCAKLEYLLQSNMKDKYTVLGKKKDYWDYFCSCLGSTKGMNDGLKYVKTVGDYKTSVGRGRAYLRFCLMHQRLADSIQQCVMNGKVTSDWYHPKSIWLQHDKSSTIVSALYDLSDLKFDLTPRGYDLDNAWPSFAKKNSGAHNWNPPSRADSLSSLISIPGQDLDSSRYGLSSTPNDSVDHLTHELSISENVRSDLSDKIEALEHQKLSFQQSIMETRKELDGTQSQLEALQIKHESLLQANKDLQQKHDRLTLEVEAREKSWIDKEKMYETQLKNSNSANDKMTMQINSLEEKLQKSENSRKDSESSTISRISELESVKNEFQLQIRTLTQDLESSKVSDSKHVEIISNQEDKIKDLEKRNSELLQKIESVLVDKNMEASSQIDSTVKLQEVLVNLKEEETERLKLKLEKEQIMSVLEKTKADNEELMCKLTSLEESAKTEKENLQSQVLSLNEQNEQIKNQLQEQSEDYKNKQGESSNELEAKEKENVQLAEKIEELNENLLAKENEIKNLVVKFEEKNEECQSLKSTSDKKITELEENLELFKCKISDQEEIVAKLTDDLKDKKELLSKETEKLKEMETEKSQMRKTIDDFEQGYQESRNKSSSLEKELNGLKEQWNLERGTTDEVKEALENKMSLIREMEIKLERLRQVIDWIGNNFDVHEGQMPPKLEDENFKGSVNTLWENVQEKCILSKKLQESNGKLLSDNLSLQQKIDDQGKQLSKLNENLSSLQLQYQNVCDSEKLSQQEKVNFEQKIKNLTEESDSKSKELEKRMVELQDFNKECEKLRSENESCRVEIDKKLEEIVTLKDKTSKSEERLQQSEETAKQNSEKQQKNSEKIKEQKKVIKENKDTISKLRSKIQENENLKENLEREKNKAQQENETLRKTITGMQQALEERKSVIENNDKLLTQTKNEKEKMQTKYKEIQTNLFDSEQKLDVLKSEKEKEEKEHNRVLDQLEKERKNLTDNLEEALSDLRSIKEQLNNTSTELENAYHEKERIENEKEQVVLSKSKLESLLTEFTEKTQKLDAELEVRTQDLEDFKSKFSHLEVDNQNLQKERTKSQEELENLRSEFDAVASRKDEEIKQLNNIQLDLSDKLFNLNEENCRINEILAKIKKEKEILLKEKEDIQNQVKTLESEIEKKNSELSDAMDNLKHSLEEKDRQCEEAIEKIENEKQLEIDSLKQENSAIQFQLSSEQMQHEEALQTFSVQEDGISDMKEKLLEQESMIENLEQEMKEIKSVRDREQEKQKQQFEEILAMVNTKESQLKDIESKLQKKCQDFEDQKIKADLLQQKLEETQSEDSDIKQKQEEEITMLKSDTVQLKKKLVKLIKEKDTLWQKTDRLAFQQKIQATEKWMDDSKVTNCMGCNTEFSFTLRKHHCRVCGRIFCYNCSNNWIMTAHSSKKERACNGCYIRQSRLEDGSSLTGEDSEDDLEKSVTLPSMYKSRTGASASKLEETTEETTRDDKELTSSTDNGQSESLDVNTISIPGQVASGITVSMVDNETDELKTAKQARSGSEDVFHLISDEEVAKSLTISNYESDVETDPNLTRSLAISTEELEKGEVNSCNEIWIKPGKSFAVPVLVENINTTLCWEFKSHPKDVVFSVCFQSDNKTKLSEAQTLVPSCKCDSHKQAVKGELTAKQVGIYTLVFDNTYSRLTSKKIEYLLWSKKSTS